MDRKLHVIMANPFDIQSLFGLKAFVRPEKASLLLELNLDQIIRVETVFRFA